MFCMFVAPRNSDSQGCWHYRNLTAVIIIIIIVVPMLQL